MCGILLVVCGGGEVGGQKMGRGDWTAKGDGGMTLVWSKKGSFRKRKKNKGKERVERK